MSRESRVMLSSRVFVKRTDGALLLIRRSPICKNNKGKWEVPGGKVDEGEDVVCAQRREVREETGLLIEPTTTIEHVHTYTIEGGPHHGWIYCAFFCIAHVVGGDLALSEEHTEHVWVEYSEMFTYDLTSLVKDAAAALEPDFKRVAVIESRSP